MTTISKQQFSLIVLIAFVVGGLSGAVIGPIAANVMRSGSDGSNTDTRGTLRDTNHADEESAVVDVVRETNPAVVNIGIFHDANAVIDSSLNTFPFEDLFGLDVPFDIRVPDEARTVTTTGEPDLRQVGGGSGFLVEANGLIVTNKHVVADPDAVYRVMLSDGREFEATVLAKDPVWDVALIKIKAEGLPTLDLGDSDSLALGQTVIAIGNTLSEFGNTVTRGVVSGIGRQVEAGDRFGFSEVIDQAIQTDAAINPGNSGGPLLNLAGQVVGINTAVSSEGQSVGFAIPINSVKRVIESVQETGRIIRPWLGIRYSAVTPRLADLNDLPVTYGAIILRGQNADELAVMPGSPANKAGLVENDIILEIDGEKLEDKDSVAKIIARHGVGDEVRLKVLHAGQEKDVMVMLEEFPIE